MALDPTEFAAAMNTYLAANNLSIAHRRGLAAAVPATLRQGEAYFATDTGSLFLGNGDGSEEELACLGADTLVGYDATHNGKIKLANGYMRIWGEFPCDTLASDAGTGGYTTTINLNDTFVGNSVAFVAFRYAAGGDHAYIHTISTTQIKIGGAVNASGAYLSWCVEGFWK